MPDESGGKLFARVSRPSWHGAGAGRPHPLTLPTGPRTGSFDGVGQVFDERRAGSFGRPE